MKRDEENQQKIEKVVKETLAEILGIETEDIEDKDYLVNNLHMGPAEITDLIEKLAQREIPIPENAFEEINTVEELVDYILNNVDF